MGKVTITFTYDAAVDRVQELAVIARKNAHNALTESKRQYWLGVAMGMEGALSIFRCMKRAEELSNDERNK